MKKIIFSVIGAIMGLPLSYIFQDEFIQKVSGGFVDYTLDINRIIFMSDINTVIFISVAVSALIGFLIGLKLDKTKK